MHLIGSFALLVLPCLPQLVAGPTQVVQVSVESTSLQSDPFAARKSAAGWSAYNPGQDWQLEFDGKGFLASPTSHQWVWGLQLEGYGFEGQQLKLHQPVACTSAGGRIAYDWGHGFEEWYINDARGLEHGFTLQERPARDAHDGAGALVLDLAIQGQWHAQISSNGRDITFLSKEGLGALEYNGLYAFDAEGRELEASFRMASERLEIHVDECRAIYPITIDPIAQQLFLKASNTDAEDYFGFSTAISGDTLVIGAPNEDSSANSVNGSQSDNSAPNAGAAYVFVRQGGAWVQQAYLKASNAGAADNFGYAVAISGDTIVVGALQEASVAQGIDGNQQSNAAFGSGAAYVFVRQAGVWTQEAYLKASNAEAGDNFGWSVAASGDTVAVAGYLEASNATGINRDQADNSLIDAGAVYVFARSGNHWTQESYIKPSSIDSGDMFGWCMAMHGDTLVVGSNMEASAATGVNGDDTDNSAPQAGAAYVFSRNAGTWAQTAYLKASNTEQGDRFACGLDYSGGLLVIGATYEDSSATGIDGDQLDNSVPSTGAVYVFDWNGTDWFQVAYLKPPQADLRDHFGHQIAVHGDRIVIGAWEEDSSAAGFNGDGTDNQSNSAGAAYVFERVGSAWQFKTYIKASNTREYAAFAHAIDMDGDALIIGAPGEDSAATGVNGNQGDISAPAAGAAYLFTLNGPSAQVPFCFGDGSGGACPCGTSGTTGAGCPNSFSNGARLSSGGAAVTTADSLTFLVQESAPGSTGLLLQGNMQFGAGGLLLGNGLLCSQSQKRWQTMVSDSTGGAFYGPGQFSTHHHAIEGATLFYQWWYRDPADTCGGGFNFSNAVAVTWQ